MTKISVFGEEPKGNKELKKIEFVTELDLGQVVAWSRKEPKAFDNIVLLFKNDPDMHSLDCMLVWNDEHNKFIVYGHWNDGVV